jgi:YidC/Oxa1 family membrane protein insertase
MDRNNILGFVFIFAILAGSFWLMKPSQDEIKKEQQLQDSIKRAKDGLAPISDSLKAVKETPKVADSVLLAQPFGAASVGTEQIVTIENELLKVNVSSKGGRLKSVELKG